MENPHIETIPGTAVIQAKRFDDYPVDEPEHQKLFHKGWWQIVVESDGKNPSFPAQVRTIVLVTPIDIHTRLKFDEKNLNTIFINHGVIITAVATRIAIVQEAGFDWEFPEIVISIRSSSKEEDIHLMCRQPEIVEKPSLLN